jgi:kynureninase
VSPRPSSPWRVDSRAAAAALDGADPLAPLRALFDLPDGVIYLDGNSLGPLPKATVARLQQVIHDEWARGLIGSWNHAGWIDLPKRVGDKIARLVGAGAGELVAADSTSVNLFKVLSAALQIARVDAPARRVILSERHNFPTDLYIAEALARDQGFDLELIEPEQLTARLDERVAVLMLTQVNYRTGRLHDMAAVSRAAHAAGALAVWDLAHSAGALPIDLHGGGDAAAAADFAVGCGYKYLNGGPGAPAFVWVHPRHAERFWQPLAGWMGHTAPFEFTPGYRPAAGVARYLCGTPAVLGLSALECGVDTVLAAEGIAGTGRGLAALREKSLALTRLFADLVEQRCAGHGLVLVSPRADAERGSQVCLGHAEIAYPTVQALIARGVVGDFRAGERGHLSAGLDILRFGFTPLYTRYVDVWDAVDHLREVLERGEWREARFHVRSAVT